MRLAKAWTAINRVSVIWKSELTDKIKRNFFQAAVGSILLYGCTPWMLTKPMKKKLDSNYTRMLQAILNMSWRQHPISSCMATNRPSRKLTKLDRTAMQNTSRRNGDELINDIPQWTPSFGRAKAERPARTYIQQVCADTGCSLENLPGAMDDRDGWRERVREIRAGGMTWWWWW